MKFFTMENTNGKKRRTIGVGNKALATLIKAGMGWEMDKPVCAPGVRFSEENVIIFDLNQASFAEKKSNGETGLCLVPRPAIPFYQIPSEYFSGGNQVVIDVNGTEIGA